MERVMQSKTDRHWDAWGKRNPYLGVLGVETAAVDDELVKSKFFTSGEDDVDRVLATISARFGELDSRSRVLDFGCGVGRLVIPFARKFNSVVGVDVSEAMLSLARENTKQFSNVSYSSNLRSISELDQKFDLVHSYIVLQHIRPVQGMPLIRNLISLLAPGGIFALHVTTGDSRPSRGALNWMRYRFPPAHFFFNLVRGRPLNEPITEMNRYDPFAIIAAAADFGCTGCFVFHLDQNGHKGMYFLGQIPEH